MGIELGRISGPLLASNLVRKNSGAGEENLAFESDLLYLDVINGRIGVNTDVPTRLLTINGTTSTTDLIVDTHLETPNFYFSTNRIQNLSSSITLLPDQTTDPIVAGLRFDTDNFKFTTNAFSNKTADSDINLSPDGTGQVIFNSLVVNVNGNLHATGNITWDGDIILGDNSLGGVEFKAEVDSNIIPNLSETYDLGTSSKRWNNVYTTNLTAETLTYDTITINNVNLLLTQGNTYYVSINGNDTYVGNHLHNTFRTIKHALSQATAGDTVVIFPGTYEEEFPLTVPAGVTVNGSGIRAVTVVPTEETNTNNAFLLNGETTVNHLTVKDFSTGYAFSFAPGFTVTSRSPYVQNITVITNTAGSTSPVEIYVDPLGLAGSYSPNSVAVDQINYTQSQVESWIGKLLVTWNGETAPVTFYEILDVIDDPVDPGVFWRIVLDSNITPGEEIYQFSIYPNSGETSIIGSAGYTAATDYSRSFLKSTLPPSFNTTVTEFWTCQIGESLNIVDSIEEDPTNSNWWKVNFKNITAPAAGLPIFTSLSNDSAGNGALADGSLATSSSREASMLFHSVTMIVPNGVGIKATNGARVEWLDSFTYFADKGIYLTQGTEGFANLGAKYGAEFRSIGSANVYGNYGAIADGANTLAYLISHNFAYIGTGLDTSNDPLLVSQANETTELNDGRIYYESVDHKGDFRIGDIFYVNQETGAVLFDAQAITFSPTGSISLEGPTSNAYIDYSIVQVGNIQIYDNIVKSLIGPVNFLASSGSTYLNTDVFVTGNTSVSADINIDGNLFLGNEVTDTITVFPNLTQNLVPDDVGGPFTLGTDSTRWNRLFATLVDVDGATQITTNTISTLTADTDLVFLAAGTGQVQITNTDVEISNNLTVDNILTVNSLTSLKNISFSGNILQTGDWNQTGNTEIIGTFANNNIEITGSSYFEVPNISIFNSEISATATNDNLNFTGAGTAGVIIDQRLKLVDSTISNVWQSADNDTQKSIILQPNGTGNTVINSSNALTIPIGNTTDRTIGIGEIRYNNITNLVEAGSTTGLFSFNGLYDTDRNTYIRAGATDNTIYFGINDVELATLDSTTLQTARYYFDNVEMFGNTINNRVSGNDLVFEPNGLGNTVLNNVAIGNGGNQITNLTDSALTFTATGNGYFKFSGTYGLRIPTGASAERRPAPEIGETRYNTEDAVTEVYSGDPLLGNDGWIPAIGTSGEISAEDVLDLLEIYTLVLG